MNEPITAVLLNWRRPHNIPPIVESLSQCRRINQIIIWDNSGSRMSALDLWPQLPWQSETMHLMVETAARNSVTFGRYQAVVDHAVNDLIYVQDDDIVLNNLPELIEAAGKHPSCITAALPQEAGSLHYAAEYAECKTAWLQLGWGGIFRAHWLEVIEQYLDRYEVDQLLYRKFDRIFTALIGPERHHAIVANVRRLTNPDGNISGTDEHSLWLRPDHMQLTYQALERVKELRE